MRREMTLKEALEDIRNRPTVPLWPQTALALGVSRSTVYGLAQRHEIDVIKLGRSIKAVSAGLRKRLSLDAA